MCTQNLPFPPNWSVTSPESSFANPDFGTDSCLLVSSQEGAHLWLLPPCPEGTYQTLFSWAEGAEVPEETLPSCFAEGPSAMRGAGSPDRRAGSRWAHQAAVVAAMANASSSQGVCSVKWVALLSVQIKNENQTLKLISFPSVSSVCSAVPVGSSPPSPVHPNFTLGLGSSGCCQGLCRPGELQAPHSSLGKSSKGRSSQVSEPET